MSTPKSEEISLKLKKELNTLGYPQIASNPTWFLEFKVFLAIPDQDVLAASKKSELLANSLTSSLGNTLKDKLVSRVKKMRGVKVGTELGQFTLNKLYTRATSPEYELVKTKLLSRKKIRKAAKEFLRQKEQ